MKCRNLKILCGMFFLAFCSLFGLSSQVYATDVQCEYDLSNKNINQIDFSDCDLSVFGDSISPISNPLYYTLDFNISSLSRSITGLLCNANNTQGCAIFIRGLSTGSSKSVLNDNIYVYDGSGYGYIYNRYFQRIYFNGDWVTFGSDSSVKIIISDEFFFGFYCPVCEECQQCPAIPENPYDDKLDNIVNAIYICAATLLVIYFFYCIYRIIIKNSGVK